MPNRFFDRSSTIDRLKQGPLADYIDSFADLLCKQRFPRSTGRFQIRVVTDFSRWLKRKHLGPETVHEHVIAQHLHGYRTNDAMFISKRSPVLKRLLHMLRCMGVAAEHAPVVTPHEEITGAYRQYLLQERGLSERTAAMALSHADRFLSEQFPDNCFDFTNLSPREVMRFVHRHAARVSFTTAKMMVGALRGFLRYLQYRGEIHTDLAACIPSVPPRPVSSVPRFLPAGAVRRILKSCDRTTALGRRNYAILLLLARLGLRCSEIVSLSLDDIDWDIGQITIQGKGGRSSRLPLMADVGKALADYLRHDRLHRSSRRLFLTQRAPLAEISGDTIRSLIPRAMARAGVVYPRKGPHVFRHTLATEMLQRGASLEEIGQVLRHGSPNTTRVYAKVDLTTLRKLALRWPGGAQ